MNDLIQDTYDFWSRKYDETRPPHTYLGEHTALNWLEPSQGDRVLDAACGTGRNTSLLSDLGAEVIGFDLSPGMLKIAQEKCARAKFVQGNLEGRLPFEDACFDKIICAMALKHVDDLVGVFAEFRRIIRPEGLLVFSASHERANRENYFPAIEAPVRLTNLHNYGSKEFGAALHSAGWMLEKSADLCVDESIRHLLMPESFSRIAGTPLVLLMCARRVD